MSMKASFRHGVHLASVWLDYFELRKRKTCDDSQGRCVTEVILDHTTSICSFRPLATLGVEHRVLGDFLV
jgi:hypothetical protein